MPTVLVVDDEPNIVELLETWLETIGCEVVSAGDGIRAVEKARDLRPDLILMDQMMPRMTGFDACVALKSDPLTKDIPLIFLTVQGGLQDVIKGLELGAHGYMTKPFKPQELLARVSSLLKLKRVQDQLKEHVRDLDSKLMAQALHSLPYPVLIFERESGNECFVNRRWQNEIGGLEASCPVWEQLRLDSSTEVLELFQSTEDEIAADLSRGAEFVGAFRLRFSSFHCDGRDFRQLVLEKDR